MVLCRGKSVWFYAGAGIVGMGKFMHGRVSISLFLTAFFCVASIAFCEEKKGFFEDNYAKSPLEGAKSDAPKVVERPTVVQEPKPKDLSDLPKEGTPEGNLLDSHDSPLVEGKEDEIAEIRGEPIKKIYLVSSLYPLEHFKKNLAEIHEVLSKHLNLELGAVYAVGLPPRDATGGGQITFLELNETLDFDPQEKGLTDDTAQQKLEGVVAQAFTSNPRIVRGMQINHGIVFLQKLPENLPATRSPSWLIEAPDGGQTLLDGIENIRSLINSKGELINTELLKQRDIPAKLLRSN